MSCVYLSAPTKGVVAHCTPHFQGKESGIQVLYKDETIWATQKAMAELFGVDRIVITRHLKNIFDCSELQQHSVCAKFAHTAGDGKTYNTAFYNLDAIISVGYRVHSVRATLSALTYKESIRSANVQMQISPYNLFAPNRIRFPAFLMIIWL